MHRCPEAKKLQRTLATLAQATCVCFLWLVYEIHSCVLRSILLAAQLVALDASPLGAAPSSVGLLPSRTAQPVMPVREDRWDARSCSTAEIRVRAVRSVRARSV